MREISGETRENGLHQNFWVFIRVRAKQSKKSRDKSNFLLYSYKEGREGTVGLNGGQIKAKIRDMDEKSNESCIIAGEDRGTCKRVARLFGALEGAWLILFTCNFEENYIK